jgi:hypothetical protein
VLKHLRLATICFPALLSLGMAGCPKGKGAPVYDECLLTVSLDVNGQIIDAVADCIDNKGKISERRGGSLDGMYMYSEESRANIIRWGKAACNK